MYEYFVLYVDVLETCFFKIFFFVKVGSEQMASI